MKRKRLIAVLIILIVLITDYCRSVNAGRVDNVCAMEGQKMSEPEPSGTPLPHVLYAEFESDGIRF